jgi:hypothetical protein
MNAEHPASRWLIAGLVATLAACGDAMPDNYKPTLATITGTIEVTPSPPQDSEIRVALLWATNAASFEDKHVKHVVAQDVEVVAVTWPAQFELAITDVPPDNAIDNKVAGGAVVAYRDANGDGQLNFTPPDADAFIDEVVAYDSSLVVWYSDPSNDSLLFPPGFSSSKGSIETPITLADHSALAASCHLLEWDLRDPANGPAGTGPWDSKTGVSHSMNYCPNSPFQDYSGPWDGDGSPPAETDALKCFATEPNDPISGSYDAYWRPDNISPFIAQTCGDVVRSCHALRLSGGGTPIPSGWPCPCDAGKYDCL